MGSRKIANKVGFVVVLTATLESMLLMPSEQFHPINVYHVLLYAVISRISGVGCTLRDSASLFLFLCVKWRVGVIFYGLG